MYFTYYKRKMFYRVTSACLVFTVVVLFLYGSNLAQHVFCGSPAFALFESLCSISNSETWNILHHLGGNGPWIPRYTGRDDRPQKLPYNCRVDQVHMISRHAERFPTRSAGSRHIELLEKLQRKDVQLTGSLDFLNYWTYFTDIDNPSFENLTTSGPYAGTTQAYNTGKKLRQRYDTLVNENKTTNFWTCSSGRDVATAQYFGNGFFGDNWQADGGAQLHIIPEESNRGADTLTPGDTCLNYIVDKEYGHDKGYARLQAWQDVFTKSIATRLMQDAGGLALTPLEIYGMMEMCGFEILARGTSPWCDVFSHQEWLEFEYARDLLHFYRAGPGNDFAGVMGWLWLNATTSLMMNDDASGVYFSFVHDGDIVPLLATLGLFDEPGKSQYLPDHKMKPGREWKTSDIVPMSGRLIFERITCENTGLAYNLKRSYVRLYINDGIYDLEKTLMGAGLPKAAGMTQWIDLVQKKGEKFGDFRDVCGLPADSPSKISFLQPQYQ